MELEVYKCTNVSCINSCVVTMLSDDEFESLQPTNPNKCLYANRDVEWEKIK